MAMLLLLFILFYVLINTWVMFTSSLWTMYFGLEMQWMVLVMLILVYDPVWSGLFNFILLNGMISMWLIIGVLFSNWLLMLFSLLGKMGFFPFSVLVCYQYYLTSFNWIMADLLNKMSYFNGFMMTMHYSSLIVGNFVDLLILLNALIIMFFISFVLSIKHLILISSLQLFLYILCILYFEEELFIFYFGILYMLCSLYLMWDCQSWNSVNIAATLSVSMNSTNNVSWSSTTHTELSVMDNHLIFNNASVFNDNSISLFSSNNNILLTTDTGDMYVFDYSSISKLISNTSNISTLSLSSTYFIYLTLLISYIHPLFIYWPSFFGLEAKTTRMDSNCSFTSNSSRCFFNLPFFLTDLSNVKQWVFINYVLLMFYWMTLFSFFPSMMFLLKFMFILCFINHSLGWAFSMVISLVFIFQAFYMSSLGCMVLEVVWTYLFYFDMLF